MMIHQHRLVLEPISPTILTNLLMNPLPEGVLERGLLEASLLSLTTSTANLIHGNPGCGRRTYVASGKDKAPKTDSAVKAGPRIGWSYPFFPTVGFGGLPEESFWRPTGGTRVDDF